MTLHSVATCYPETPTQSERDLMYSWLDMFRDTITCPHCRDHFAAMLQAYRSSFPGMLRSRQEFTLFTFRAHNAVNRRLNKPIFGTVEECMATLQTNVKTRSAVDYRVSYLNHISKYWRSWQDITGMMALKKITEMRKIEATYIQPRDTNFNVTIQSDVVVLPRDAMEPTEEQGVGTMRIALPSGNPGRFQLTSKGFRIRR